MKGVLECAHVLPLFPDEKLCVLLLNKLPIVKELVDSLEILYNATMTCQKADLNLTDFYKCWIITKLKIQSRINRPSKTKLDESLLKSMAKRESKLIGNQLMNCAMILDPRFCDELSIEQTTQTKELLLGIWNKLKRFRHSESNLTDGINENNVQISDSDIFNSYMRNKNKHRQTIVECTTTNNDVINSINTFIAKETFEEPCAEDGFSIIQYWESKKKEYPILFEIAMVILAIAPTQVTIERMFSAFGHLYNDYRTSLSQKLLEDILLICLNLDLLEVVNKEDINNLLIDEKSSQ